MIDTTGALAGFYLPSTRTSDTIKKPTGLSSGWLFYLQ